MSPIPFHRLGEPGGPFDPWAWFNVVGAVGCALWVWPNPVPLWHAFDRAWFFVDLVVVYQLLRHGRALQRVPEVRRHFHAIVAVTMVAGGIGLHTFHLQYRDILGLVSAFIINL